MSTDLPTLLLASLHPTTRKQAESNLNELSLQPGFITALLRLVLEASQDRAVRLAGGVYLKNLVKLRWEEVSRLGLDWVCV
jgi:exportin-2 (importin alpha re-exporter)